MTRNEAAERLRSRLRLGGPFLVEYGTEDLDAALAEERRHVIEQIRERLTGTRWMPGDIAAILDDLSTPEQKR